MKVKMNVSKNEIGPPEPKMFKKTICYWIPKRKKHQAELNI